MQSNLYRDSPCKGSGRMLRVIYELSPPEAIEALVRVTSTGVPAIPAARGRLSRRTASG